MSGGPCRRLLCARGGAGRGDGGAGVDRVGLLGHVDEGVGVDAVKHLPAPPA